MTQPTITKYPHIDTNHIEQFKMIAKHNEGAAYRYLEVVEQRITNSQKTPIQRMYDKRYDEAIKYYFKKHDNSWCSISKIAKALHTDHATLKIFLIHLTEQGITEMKTKEKRRGGSCVYFRLVLK